MTEKAILLSLLGSWSTAIFLYGKREEIRTTRPNIQLPVKVFVYCSQNEKLYMPCVDADSPETAQDALQSIYLGKQRNSRDTLLSGTVIGSFICSGVREYNCSSISAEALKEQQKRTLVSPEQFIRYTNGHTKIYGWNITKPTLFAEPIALTEFTTPEGKIVKRPPMSWAYIKNPAEK